MQSLIIGRYHQPYHSEDGRIFGRICSVRDTQKHPVRFSKYRLCDRSFKRTKNLLTIQHRGKLVKAYYAERMKVYIKLPLPKFVFRLLGLV